ncbi:hypothetical protein AALA80_02280 [Oscillospiraceae bacterium 50-60]
MRDEFQIWVDAVCEQVRFWPDRKGIEKELRIHYEDHCRALERLNYEPKLAAERSLRAMGNAQEVGWALDRIHKPWLGWLWKFSEGTLLMLVLIVLWLTVSAGGVEQLIFRTRQQLEWTDPPVWADHVSLECGDVYLAPGEVRETGGNVEAELRFWVKVREPVPDFQPWELEVADNRGAVSFREWGDGRRQTSGYLEWERVPYWGWTRQQMTLRLILDYRPDWVEVSAPGGGRDWVLRAEWGEEP